MHESKENTEHASSVKEVCCYFRHKCFPVSSKIQTIEENTIDFK